MIIVADISEKIKQSLPILVPSDKNEAINIAPHIIVEIIAKAVDNIPKKINECESIAVINANVDTHIRSVVKVIKTIFVTNFIL